MGTVGETVGRLLVTSMLYDTSKRLVYVPDPHRAEYVIDSHCSERGEQRFGHQEGGRGHTTHHTVWGAGYLTIVGQNQNIYKRNAASYRLDFTGSTGSAADEREIYIVIQPILKDDWLPYYSC